MRLRSFALYGVDGVAPLGAQGANQAAMDARNIRIGETGLDELIQWLRQTGQPQTLEALTERYLQILRGLVRVEEGS